MKYETVIYHICQSEVKNTDDILLLLKQWTCSKTRGCLMLCGESPCSLFYGKNCQIQNIYLSTVAVVGIAWVVKLWFFRKDVPHYYGRIRYGGLGHKNSFRSDFTFLYSLVISFASLSTVFTKQKKYLNSIKIALSFSRVLFP